MTIERHSEKINQLERVIEKHSDLLERVSEQTKNTENNLKATADLSNQNKHNIGTLKRQFEQMTSSFKEFEVKMSEREGFEKGKNAVRDNSRNRNNFIIGVLTVVIAALVAFISIHEFFDKKTTPQINIRN